MWVLSPAAKSKAKLSGWKKTEIENRCRPLVERFKQQYVNTNPGKRFNYLTDVFIKWRGNNLYFCEKFKSEQEGMMDREFEEAFVRLDYMGNDSFNLSWFRHTGKWFQVANDLRLDDCLEMIETNPNFHPIS